MDKNHDTHDLRNLENLSVSPPGKQSEEDSTESSVRDQLDLDGVKPCELLHQMVQPGPFRDKLDNKTVYLLRAALREQSNSTDDPDPFVEPKSLCKQPNDTPGKV